MQPILEVNEVVMFIICHCHHEMKHLELNTKTPAFHFQLPPFSILFVSGI